jgi:hypothetical protein
MFKHAKHKPVSSAYLRRGRITEEWCRGAGYGSVMQARFEPCSLDSRFIVELGETLAAHHLVEALNKDALQARLHDRRRG